MYLTMSTILRYEGGTHIFVNLTVVGYIILDVIQTLRLVTCDLKSIMTDLKYALVNSSICFS